MEGRESASETPDQPPPKRRKLSTWGCLGFLALGLFLLFLGFVGVLWLVNLSERARLAAYVAEIKATGAPTDAESLVKVNAVPEGEIDLTPRYLAVFEEFRKVKRAPEYRDLPIVGLGKGPPPFDEHWPDLERAEAYLAERTWLATLDELGETDGAVAYPLHKVDSFPEVNFTSAHDVVRDLRLRFHVQLRRGDRTGALRTIATIVALTRGFERCPLADGQLFRGALRGMAIELALDLLRSGISTAEERDSLRRATETDSRSALARLYKGERACVLIVLRHMTLDGLEQVQRFNKGASPFPLGKVLRGSLADLCPADVQRFAMQYDALIKAASAPTFHDMRTQILAANALQEQLKTTNPSRFDAVPFSAVKILEMVYLLPYGEAKRLALRAALDLEDRLHELPEERRSTTEAEMFLANRLATEEYADPFDGQPLRFKITSTAVIVYSVGKDGVDNDGDIEYQGKTLTDVGVRIARPLLETR